MSRYVILLIAFTTLTLFGCESHYVVPAGGVEHRERVHDHRVDVRVASHAGDRPQVDGWVERGEEKGAGVVDTSVDVEDHGVEALARRSGERGLAGADRLDAVARRLQRGDQDLADDRRIVDREDPAAAGK